ncbi:MAG: hypothetical protein KDC67_11205, partial [Ignavibacteriae bacterium]|nr:hypothetical protein [Ignavibacteriota bacterium]
MSEHKHKQNKTDISLKEILRVLSQRKFIILAIILLSIIAAFLFNIFKSPVYQSSVLLKKEILSDQKDDDIIRTILSGRTQDELETEMQLVTTRQVLDKVIDELSLNININKIVEADGTVTVIDLPLAEYQHKYELNDYPATFPEISSLCIGLYTKPAEFKILGKSNNDIDIINSYNERVINDGKTYSNISSSEWKVNVSWKSNSLGSEVHFESLDYNDVLDNLYQNIFTEKKIKTNIFELFARSNYPYTTTEIANVLAEQYRQSRIDIQKDNIKYSFKFIDDRLKEVAHNLENAENDLSYFKSTEKIAQIDEQSKQLVTFLSNLESEKLKTDLSLGEYKNKLRSIEKQMVDDGYVDQTYLTPEQYSSYDSPFMNLLKELTNAELKRIELLQKRTEMHPDVILIDEQISRIKEELSKYNNNTLTAFRIISNSLKNKQENINSIIAKYSADLEKLPEQESKLASLMRQKEAYEKMYTLLLQKREEMRVAELSKLQDIIILDKAIEPIKPIAPNKKLNLLFASLFGL